MSQAYGLHLPPAAAVADGATLAEYLHAALSPRTNRRFVFDALKTLNSIGFMTSGRQQRADQYYCVARMREMGGGGEGVSDSQTEKQSCEGGMCAHVRACVRAYVRACCLPSTYSGGQCRLHLFSGNV